MGRLVEFGHEEAVALCGSVLIDLEHLEKEALIHVVMGKSYYTVLHLGR